MDDLRQHVGVYTKAEQREIDIKIQIEAREKANGLYDKIICMAGYCQFESSCWPKFVNDRMVELQSRSVVTN